MMEYKKCFRCGWEGLTDEPLCKKCCELAYPIELTEKSFDDILTGEEE